MKKKLVSLLIAFVMAFAISMTVMAYDALQDQPTDTQYELVAVHHWVVRGDTLAGISAAYDVPVATIMARNFPYFHDLWLRSTTYGVGFELEPGVRLHIGYMLEIRHWVWRGDTLANIGNGAAFRNPDGTTGALAYGIDLALYPFTPSQIRAQNPRWFAQMAQLAATRNIEYDLEESFHMLNVQNWTITDPYVNVNTMAAFADRMFGSPLVLRTMVEPNPLLGLTGPMPYSDLIWLCDAVAPPVLRPANAETVPSVGPLQQTTFNPWATNPLLIGHYEGWSVASYGIAQANFLVAIGGGGTALVTFRPY